MEGGAKALEGYPIESLALYSFSWQFDGECGYGEFGGCYFKLCRDGEVKESCEGVISKALGLDEELDDFYEMIKDDPLLWCVAKKYRGLRPGRLGVWEAAVVGVAQQNASFKQAWKAIYKLHLLTSRRVNVFGKEYLSFPKKEDVDEASLKEAGFGYRAETITKLKKVEVDCSNVDELKKIKGIGDYTLGLIKLFGCHDYSAPILDRWLRSVFLSAYGDLDVYHSFGKWRGLVSLLTTVALDAVPLRKALKRLKEGKVCPSEEPSPLTLWKYF